jgi:3'-5' exoribonuclease
MKSKYIKDLAKNDQLSGETFVLKLFKKNQTRSGDEYFKFELGDKTGSISGNMWKDNIKNCDEEKISEGCIVTVYAKVEDYKGALQLNIISVGLCEEYDEEDFVTVSERDPEEMWERFKQHVSSMDDKDYFGLITTIFKDENTKEIYRKHPAAERVHHAFRYGLLEHVLEILDMAEALMEYYPKANKSLVKAGIILHDIGKIKEIEDQTTAYKKTDMGTLIGHIVLGYEFVCNIAADDFPEDKLLKLKHIILSHHGILEYGSPVVPMCIEAIIVSVLDDASAKVRQYQRILKENESKSEAFSERDMLLGTKIYLK